MKILHIAPIGHQSEGIGTVLKHLEKEQNALGHDVRIVSKYKNEVYNDWNFTTINNNSDFLCFLELWSPNIVIFHSMYEMEYIGFSKVLRKMKIPYLIQMHGALSKEHYKKGFWKKWIANRLWFNSFLQESQCLIYLNQAEYDNCVVKYLNSNYAIIPNGCDSNIENFKEKATKEIVDILYIGRIDINHKGLDVLVNAIKTLKAKKISGIHFSFYGNENDSDVDEFKTLLKPLKGYAEFKGGIYGEEKQRRLQDCDIFILTSRYEGMPMGVLEALSYGIPCLLTPGTNMADVIISFNAGWSTDFTANSISNTIEKACNDLRNAPMAYRKNAFDLSKQYSWNSIAKETISVYLRFYK